MTTFSQPDTVSHVQVTRAVWSIAEAAAPATSARASRVAGAAAEVAWEVAWIAALAAHKKDAGGAVRFVDDLAAADAARATAWAAARKDLITALKAA